MFTLVAVVPENHPLRAASEIALDRYKEELNFCKGIHDAVVLRDCFI